MQATPTILIVEDQPLTLLGLKMSLESLNKYVVAGEATSGEEAVTEARRIQPDIILMDVSLPQMDGIEASWRIKQDLPRTRIMMFTSHNTSDTVAAALGAGADAYCLKSRSIEQVSAVIDNLLQGKVWIDPLVADVVVRAHGAGTTKSKVTLAEFEMQVLKLIRDGWSTHQIAEQLNASEDAVAAVMRGIIQAYSYESAHQKDFTLATAGADNVADWLPATMEMPDATNIFADKYLIDSVLGKGGMGTVYKAQHIYMKRHVALKVLHPNLTREKKALREFQQEAMSIACLNHDGIIRIYDFGVSGRGEPYIVMELFEGITLDTILKHELHLTLPRFKSIFLQVCDALIAAHAAGVVHCDIKPSNFILNRDDDGVEHVKLADFGVSKVMSKDLAEDLAETSEKGQKVLVSGTPSYMSPEQCSGRELDQRTDIYALGCVMFESLTGTKAFSGNNITEVFTKHFHEVPPPVSAMIPFLIPIELDDCISKMMEKDREMRVQTIEQVRTVIASLPDPQLTP
ncbi:MAG TPA: protein kinase [Oculatellaceae cyanobacterium]